MEDNSDCQIHAIQEMNHALVVTYRGEKKEQNTYYYITGIFQTKENWLRSVL